VTLYAGESVALFATARHPITGDALTDLTAVAHLWHQERDGNPKTDPDVRSSPRVGPITMTYDEIALGYIGYVNGSDLDEPGKWWYRVTLEGSSWANVEFASLTVKA
jgi:hypothetical protein